MLCLLRYILEFRRGYIFQALIIAIPDPQTKKPYEIKIYLDTPAVIVVISVLRRKLLAVLLGVLPVFSLVRAISPATEKILVYARECVSNWYVLVVFKIVDFQGVAEVLRRDPCYFF